MVSLRENKTSIWYKDNKNRKKRKKDYLVPSGFVTMFLIMVRR